MNRLFHFLNIAILLIFTSAYAADYDADKKVDELSAHGGSVATTTKLLIPDPVDTDIITTATFQELATAVLGAAYDTTAELNALFDAQVPDSLFNAHTIIYATTDDTPAALTVTEASVVGRLTGGNISAIPIGTAANQIAAGDHTHTGVYVATEADPVVGAITGIVKANGSGTISAASAGTDYVAVNDHLTDLADGSLSGAKVGITGTTTESTVAADDLILVYDTSASANRAFTRGNFLTGIGAGQAIVLDLGDDGGNDTADLGEIATVNDTNSIFTYPSGDKLKIDMSKKWPVAASADTLTAVLTHELGGLEADVSAYSGLVKIASGSTSAVTVTAAGEAILDDANAETQRATLGLTIGTHVLAQQTIGIADNNLVEIDHAAVADNDYAKFTAGGLEGRSYSEVLSDIGAEPADAAIVKSDEAETLSANWVNTANPWADNEVVDALTISGGTVNNTVIGGTTPAAGTFTTLSAGATGFSVDADGDLTAKSISAVQTSSGGTFAILEGTGGTDYRAWSVPTTLTQSLIYRLPDGVPTAGQFFSLGAPSASVSTVSYGTFSTDNFLVSSGTVTIKDGGVSVAEISATGTPDGSTFLAGDGAWKSVSATAYTPGGDGEIQYNLSDALTSEPAFSYNPTTNTLNVTQASTNPALTVGDGDYSFTGTPQVYIEGTARIDGLLTIPLGIAADILGEDDLILASNGAAINMGADSPVSITHSASTLTFSGNLALGSNNLTMTGSIAATGNRVTKGWFTDVESTNMPTVGGTALFSAIPATLANAAASTWTVVDDAVSALSIGATDKADILKIVSTNGSEGVTTSGTFTASGAITAPSFVSNASDGDKLLNITNGTTLNATLAATDGLLAENGGVFYVSDGEDWAKYLLDSEMMLKSQSSTSLPGTCTVGEMYVDTDADTTGSLYICVSTDTWKEVDDDGGAGGLASTDIDTSAEIATIVGDETGSGGTPLLVFNQAPQIDDINLGHASDTTIARSGAGAVTIEGNQVLLGGVATGGVLLGDATPDAAGEVGYDSGKFSFFGANSEDLYIEPGNAANSAVIGTSSGVTSISFGAINLATTGTGTFGVLQSRVKFNSYAEATTLTAANNKGGIVQFTVAGEATMWACETANVGDFLTLWARDAEKIEVVPASGDNFVLFNGTALSANNELDMAATAGTKVTLVCTADNTWSVFTETAACTDGGAAD